MRKYTSVILVAVFLLSILVAVFWDWIMQVNALVIALAIIFILLILFLFLYEVGRSLLDGDRIDWSKPKLFMRPFLPLLNSDEPHRFADSDQLKPFTFPEERQER